MFIGGKIISLGITVLFILAIYIPLVGSFVQEDRAVSPAEKRKLAQLPEVPATMAMLEQYPRKFEEYFNDQFGMRDVLLKTFSGLKQLIGDTGISSSVNKVPTENTVKGKDGWFFLNRVWDGDPVSDYRNISLYSEVDLLRAALLFEARNYWLRKRGIQYLLFFAPNKHTIYHEYMPDYIVKQGDISSMDQLYDALLRYTSVEFVDLRETLLNGKKQAPLYWKDNKDDAALYYKTDSHWNGAGADLVQYEVAKRIEKMFPGLIKPEKRPPENFVMEHGTGDISRIMGRDDNAAYGPTVRKGICSEATLQQFQQQRQVTTCKTGKLNVLIFHDSFFTVPLKIFFADYFAKTTFLWETMSKKAIREQMKKGKIDLVIEERAERFLPYIPPIHSELYNVFWEQHFRHWKKVIFTLKRQFAAENTGQFKGENVRLGYDAATGTLDIKALTKDPYLEMQGIPFKEKTLYMLHLVIESQKNTQLRLFYGSLDPAIRFPDKQHTETFRIRKGSTVLYIPLFSGNLDGRLRLDPGSAAGRYRLKKFEIREVDPSSLAKDRL